MNTEDKQQGQTTSNATGEHGSPLSDIQELVGEIIEGVRAFAPKTVARFPRYDLVETADQYLLQFDLPGLSRDELEINTQGDQVIIAGDRKRPGLATGEQVRRTERVFGQFRRSVRLPTDVEIEQVRARLTDGVLTVTLPKRGDRTGRKVDIES